MLTTAATVRKLMSITMIMLSTATFPIISLFEWGGKGKG